MAFKRKINGKHSTFYYVDFRIGQKGDPRSIHVNRSTKLDTLEAATELENQWKAEAEEKYFNNSINVHNPDEILFSEAIKLCWKKRWQHNRAGERPLSRVEKIIDITGDVPISNLFGSSGYLLAESVRDQLIKDKDKSKSTIDLYMADMRTVINNTKQKLQLHDAVIPEIEMFKDKVRRTRTLSHAEEITLFKLMDEGHPHYAKLFRVLLDTGMRLSEGLNITYGKHIFLKERMIMITKEIRGNKNKGVRTIPMTKRVFKILVELQEDFPTRPFPFRQTYSSNVFQKYRNMMELQDDTEFVPHMLRHTCTTRMLAARVPKVYVQKILGHSNSIMTDHYEHLVCEDMREAADVLDTLYNKIRNLESISPDIE